MAFIDLYDSDIEKVADVNARLQLIASSGRLDRDDFDQRIRDEYAKIGIKVDVKWWYSNDIDTYIPEVEIQGRMEAHDFDHDRQFHEVTRDLLHLGEGGVIDFDGRIKSPPKSISFADTKKQPEESGDSKEE